jgi:3-methyladenine DNA glycosylase AlkD
MNANTIKQELYKLSNSEKAVHALRFFKTGIGEYGEGDIFIGVTVPEIRKIAQEHKELASLEIEKLLMSPVHEHRLTALIIMTKQFPQKQKEMYDLYLSHTQYINNWDLVDVSAPNIVGTYLLDKRRDIIFTLSKGNLWEQRIAIIATLAFIRKGEYKDTFLLAERYLTEKHDLMHKATGWMLREVGKKCGEEVLEEFLRKHYAKMPRTMLRYAIEKFDAEKRQKYLQGLVQ